MSLFKNQVFNFITAYSGSLLIIWWLLSFAATHTPIPEGTEGLPYIDKITHAIIYAILSFLLALWLNKRTPITYTQSLSIFGLLLAYSFLDESLQALVERTPDTQDIAADIVGILIGLFAFFKSKEKA